MTRRAVAVVAFALAACSPQTTQSEAPPSTTRSEAPPSAPTSTIESTTASPVTTAAPTTSTVADRHSPPPWLGTRPLPLRPDGHGVAAPTPPELVDRSIRTLDLLPDDAGFSIIEVPPDVVARSTWTPECPVGLDQLAYVTVSHWGFDGRRHTGELIVHADHAADIVTVFRRLFEARFPIEQMRVASQEDLDAPPTGDQNITSAFECRRVVGGSGSWSMHAVGEAIDINPFHNPYVRGDLVIPELASAYADRSDVRPGMIVEGDVVVQAFDAIGWQWGGRWSGLTDPMHFSTTGR